MLTLLLALQAQTALARTVDPIRAHWTVQADGASRTVFGP